MELFFIVLAVATAPASTSPLLDALVKGGFEASGAAKRVLLPGNDSYVSLLSSLYRVDATRRTPLCVVQPLHPDEVVATVRAAAALGVEVVVRGGGSSTMCAKSDAILLDLRRYMRSVAVDGADGVVRAAGGATMGEINAAAVAARGAVPAGLSPRPGLGMALQGGVGHLTRRWGLTIDNIVDVEIVTGDGALRRVDGSAPGGEAAELWWAVRGAGPSVGVVVAATFRLRLLPDGLWVEEASILLSGRALRAAHRLARGLPTRASLSISATAESISLYYAASAAPREGVASPLRTLVAQIGGWLDEDVGGRYVLYNETPPFVPQFPVKVEKKVVVGDEVAAVPRKKKKKKKKKLERAVVSLFIAHPTEEVERALVHLLRHAPSPRTDHVDWQHCGGVAGTVRSDATAFWSRSNQAFMLYGKCAWRTQRVDGTGARSEEAACRAWLDQLRVAVSPITVGVYAVDIARGGYNDAARTLADVRSAFGGNLGRIAALQRRVDPHRVFSRSYFALDGETAAARGGGGGAAVQWSNSEAQARYMRRAIELAEAAKRRGGAAYGALIVDPRGAGRIVAEGANDASRNPIWHGEMAAIANLSAILHNAHAYRNGERREGGWESDSVYAVAPQLEIYTTAEPCSMCMSAIAWSGFGKVVWGTSIPFLVSQGIRQIDVRAATIEARSSVVTRGRGVVLEGGVLARLTDLLYAKREGAVKHHHHHHPHREYAHEEL